MKLYHGSNVEIQEIDLAKRVSRIYGGSPCTTIFNFKDSSLEEPKLSKRIFQNPSKEWALFVINNRNRDFKDYADKECNLDLKYDLVTGPIANDDLALLFPYA